LVIVQGHLSRNTDATFVVRLQQSMRQSTHAGVGLQIETLAVGSP